MKERKIKPIKPWPEKEMFQLMVGLNIFEDNEQGVTITKEFKDFWMSNSSQILEVIQEVHAEKGLPFSSDLSDVIVAVNAVAIQAWVALQEGVTEPWILEISLEEIGQATICFSAYIAWMLDSSGLLDELWEADDE